MRSFIVGLTGGIGSGKSAVSDYLASLGVDVVDADVIAREVVLRSEVLEALVFAFGTDIIKDGRLDRMALRAFVFDNPDNTAALNAITHPLIRQVIISGLTCATSPYVLLSAPLLLESKGLAELCHRLLVVDIAPELQIRRACLRDGQTPANIKTIINRQIDRQSRLSRADDVVDNSGTLEQLHTQLDVLHQRYLAMAKAHTL